MNPGLFPGFTLPYSSDPYPVGAIIQSVVDLEAQSNGMWLRCDGREINRSLYPELAKVLKEPVVSALTNRTLISATPGTNYNPICAGSTCFVVGATGTSAMQYSTDGATWNAAWSAGWPASTHICDVIKAGSRFIALPYSGGTQPYVVTESGYSGGAWTATTGAGVGAINVPPQMAYSPSLALAVFMPSPAGTTVYTLADGATAWTSRTKTSSTCAGGVCWTGDRFLALTTATSGNNWLISSTDGITFSDVYAPTVTECGAGSMIASDGAGTVVIGFGHITSVLAVSKDYGSTWRIVTLPPESNYYAIDVSGVVYRATWTDSLFIKWTGTRFVGLTRGGSTVGMLVSSDGLNWFVDPIGDKVGPNLTIAAIAEKGGVIAGIRSKNTTQAVSGTWDYSKMRLPQTDIPLNVASTVYTGITQRQEYIKARMA